MGEFLNKNFLSQHVLKLQIYINSQFLFFELLTRVYALQLVQTSNI